MGQPQLGHYATLVNHRMDAADRALPLRRILLRRWNIRPVRDLPRSHVPAGEPQKLNEPSWNIQPVRDLPRSHVPAGEPQKLNEPSWNIQPVRDLPRSHVPSWGASKIERAQLEHVGSPSKFGSLDLGTSGKRRRELGHRWREGRTGLMSQLSELESTGTSAGI
ncbi:hypothetical protein CC1G_14513 [Coprinopsis cinerea okayama7|uniref:Uncharacterized protein n=1 Tax=Coprinopsis cinerea (strain Okayama-7 / 130 / ATCC MYA-4618 / FGSC 9003) TaxID=240176 RepID=D6RM53_COPC7|nr:hypothetical protein CC1G_14513 [Coprinopsis cinerea okayama7\|eukprot:XP_002911514.1 hypothetical protein CC1G_14513 [Coprinopsis cinerea okayama7\